MQKVDVSAASAEPWYRVGVMQLFVGGLAAVVIGSVMLLVTAIRHADVELHSAPMKPPSYYKPAPTVPADAARPTP